MVIGNWGAIGSQGVIGGHAAINKEGPGLKISAAESPQPSPQAHCT